MPLFFHSFTYLLATHLEDMPDRVWKLTWQGDLIPLVSKLIIIFIPFWVKTYGFAPGLICVWFGGAASISWGYDMLSIFLLGNLQYSEQWIYLAKGALNGWLWPIMQENYLGFKHPPLETPKPTSLTHMLCYLTPEILKCDQDLKFADPVPSFLTHPNFHNPS